MLVKIQGKVYFHQFSNQENGWEFLPAPDRYQSIADEDRAREVAPTEPILLHRVVGNRILPEWGFWTLVPPWIESPCRLAGIGEFRQRLVPPPGTHFNSRHDTLVGSPGWRRILARNRCVVFADAFYEWSDPDLLAAGQAKRMGQFRLASGQPMALAAVWSPVRVGEREILTVAVVTTAPNEQMRSLPHHRMPAILSDDDLRGWMDPGCESPERTLHPTPQERIHAEIAPVSRRPKTPRISPESTLPLWSDVPGE